MEKIYFIVNPNAKNGSCREIWRKLEGELETMDIPYLAFFTERAGHAEELAGSIARKLSGRQATIAAVGGDGTLHEVVNGAASYPNIIVGFIPGGSGNDFSRGFAIPKKAAEALGLVIDQSNSRICEIDIGKIQHKELHETYFMNNMGVGFDAAVAKESNESRMKLLLNRVSLGRLVYVYILAKKLLTFRTIPIHITIEGKEFHYNDAWFVTVSNQPYYGGGMKIAPGALPDDGILDVTVVHRISRWKLLLVFASVFWGKHTKFKEVVQYTGKSITIESTEPVLAHADGEAIGHTPLKIDACPKALRILTEKNNPGIPRS
ncbi:diacylglycerol kinase family lipid kinase [Bacillus sp. ISL-35]|uniref:diacylglycerol/lipid kinase family protein n=1 Tax=Bacillus sp. ISL-35 TaxID=2819122 RepID=UPI001BEBBC78|nr:diacylglycerol kinase family protein [Bacillus sp. ISL-35]MBT2680742.1 diacylglycerol kinase family lipid kinase [Bacillus sp. ISL-35]MBT2705551.1 diacylglycerol kinase family lipid kinase [Chryseobacterium sp. ISL-80]